MENVVIPKSEYLELIALYEKLQAKLNQISKKISVQDSQVPDIMKYCGKISLKKDALTIQKEMRDEWE